MKFKASMGIERSHIAGLPGFEIVQRELHSLRLN